MSGRPQLRSLGLVEYAPTVAAMQAFTAARTESTPDEIWLCQHPPIYTQGLAGKPEHLLDRRGIELVQTNRGGQITYHGPGQLVAYPLVDLKRLGIYVKEYVYRLEQAVLGTLERYGVTGHRVAGAPGIYVRLSDPFGHAMLERQGAADSSPRPDPGCHPGASRDPSAVRVHRSCVDPGVRRDDGVEGGVAFEESRPAERFAGLGKIAALGIKISRNCSYHGIALNVAMDLRPFDGINPCGYPGLRTVDLSTIGVRAPFDAVAQALGEKLAARLSR